VWTGEERLGIIGFLQQFRQGHRGGERCILEHRHAIAGGRWDDQLDRLGQNSDLIQPIKTGTIAENHIKATLADLCAGRATGRSSAEAITLFKAVGTALADLSAATRSG
jgi:hypothetical protein